MNNGLILLITLFVSLLVIARYFYWLNSRKKKHLLVIKSDWNDFEKSVANCHIEAMYKFGRKLIWNEYFTMQKLKEMSKLIKDLEDRNSKIDKNQRIKDLKLLIYNKYLDWNIEYS